MPDLSVLRARVRTGVLLSWLMATSAACIGSRVVYPVMPTGDELLEFQAAGPADLLAEDLELSSMRVGGPYRVVTGDLLSIELPPEVEFDSAVGESAPSILTIKCRVTESGTVLLPMLGEHSVGGKTTGEIEADLAEAYDDPTRLQKRLNVVVTVSEYKTASVAVIGAVNLPGLHDLRSDHMSVVGALMAAGGIKKERGAREIKVIYEGENGQTVTRSLSVYNSEIPLEDIALSGSETIVVEAATERSFTVIGLVKRSGIFQYPAPRRFNLMQALATAGGVDENAAPRYATIYRVKDDGSILGATFKIDGTSLLDGSNVLIKDGDVISVDHTQGSWLRQFFSQVLGFRASVNVSGAASPTL